MSVAAIALIVAIVLVGVLTALAYVRYQATFDADPRVAVLRATVKENPDDIALRTQLASIYEQTGRSDLALREYERILVQAPGDLGALYNTGRIRMNEGAVEAGEDSYREVLRLAPTHAYAATALGFYLEAEGRRDEIGEVVTGAADAQPNVADLQYLMGVAFEAAGGNTEAAEHYRRALELVPGMADAEAALQRLEADE